MRYKSILLFGAPGSGKGTQGKILGSIPGFYHSACGDVFRSLDLQSEMGRVFWEYSSRGELVLEHYSKDTIAEIDATMSQIKVLQEIIRILVPIKSAIDHARDTAEKSGLMNRQPAPVSAK